MSPALREHFLLQVSRKDLQAGDMPLTDGTPGTASELIFLVVDAECTETVEGRAEELSCPHMQFLSVTLASHLPGNCLLLSTESHCLDLSASALICNFTSTLSPQR